LVGQRRLGGRFVPGVVQPAVPVGRHAACFHLALEDHPAALAVGGLVIGVALVVLAHLPALAGGEKLGADGLAVPPGQQALEEIHRANLRSVGAGMADCAAKVQWATKDWGPTPKPPGYSRTENEAGNQPGRSAVTSISILWRGSIRPAPIIVAACGLAPK